MASESLIWHLIRDNNSFLVKRGQTKRDGSVQFSKEPGNLLGVHSFKYSGLANNKAIDLQATTGPKATVVLKKKNFKKAATAAANSNAKSVSKITLKKDVKTGLKNLAHIVGTGSKKVKGKEVSYTYRPDLLATASLRYKKLKKAADIRSGKGRKALPATTRNSRKA